VTPDLIVIYAFVLLSALSFHEWAHAVAATACGDDLPRAQGRLTLNPLSHIDLFGTIILPAILLIFTGFMFGYAKPVQFRPEVFRKPRRDTALVAMAGPAANLTILVVALVVAAIVCRALGGASELVETAPFLWRFFYAAIMLNFILMLFNLIPVPPLDGHYILDMYLPEEARKFMQMIGPFGILIALILARPLFDYAIPKMDSLILRIVGA
jgi:Zn-dependent protease